MKNRSVLLLIMALSTYVCVFPCAASNPGAGEKIVSKRIWGGDKYCAFTSMIRYDGRYYVSFREGESHVFDENGIAEGTVRIIASKDGENWESVANLHEAGIDLRDPKLCIDSRGRLMVLMGGSKYVGRVLKERCSRVSFSTDGVNFSKPQKINADTENKNGLDWLWRVDWQDDAGYGVMYSVEAGLDFSLERKGSLLTLLKTSDGVNYEEVAILDLPCFPNETTVRFFKDKRMGMMVREDSNGRCNAFWGVSRPPYTDWDFVEMPMTVAGQDVCLKYKNSVIVGARGRVGTDENGKGLYNTMLWKGTPDGDFTEVCVLPSSFKDNGYPGLLVVGKELWVSYYSCHETEKAAIFLAKLPLKLFK